MHGMIKPTDNARQLAERALRGAQYDWEGTTGRGGEGVIAAGQLRHGIRCLVVRDDALTDAARDALLAWRLAQYLLVNFYDTRLVAGWVPLREPREWVGPRDCHAMAFDPAWQLVAYSVFKGPREAQRRWRFGDPDRPPLLPCEAVHGRAWQGDIRSGHDIPISRCWEIGRSMVDRARRDTASQRAPIELALLGCRVLLDPRHKEVVQLVTGDLDPRVILRHLHYFFIPVATWPAQTIDLGDGHPLRPRYLYNATSPYAVLIREVGLASFQRWSDINGALDLEDEQALVRLLALGQFQSTQRPSWRAAAEVEPPGEAVVLGPGEEVARDQVIWVKEGCLQALGSSPSGQSHLATMGPGVVFVPQLELAATTTCIRAISPSRVIVASCSAFAHFRGGQA